VAIEITITAQDELTREQGHARLVISGLSEVNLASATAENTQYKLCRWRKAISMR